MRTYRDDLTWKTHQLLTEEGYRFCNQYGYFTDYNYEHPDRVFGIVPKGVRVNHHLANLFAGEPPWIATLSYSNADEPTRMRIDIHGDSFAERITGLAELLRARLGIIAEVAVATPYPKRAEYAGD